MDKKTVLYYDDQLWLMIYDSATNHQAMCSLQTLSDEMVRKGFADSNKNKVDRALERLGARGKIDRHWDGKYYRTTALKEVYVFDEPNSYFVDEKPIKLTIKAQQVYNYFIDNKLVGRRNTVSMKFLAKWIDIDERFLRKIIERINNRGYTFGDGQTFTRKIMGSYNVRNSGYYLVETKLEEDDYLRRYDTTTYKASRKSRIGREDFGRHDQVSAVLVRVEDVMMEHYEQTFSQVKAISDDMVIEGCIEK